MEQTPDHKFVDNVSAVLAGLILVTPLSNGREIASAMGLGFAASIAGGAFANDKKIKRVKAPLLVIHGTNDRVIPIQMGRKVYDAAAEPKGWYKIEGADHNDLSNRFSESYWTPIRQFVLRAISKSNN